MNGQEPSLRLFHRQFLQRLRNPTIPDGKLLKHADVQETLVRYVFSEYSEDVIRAFSATYVKQVLETVIRRTEGAITDPENEVGTYISYQVHQYLPL